MAFFARPQASAAVRIVDPKNPRIQDEQKAPRKDSVQRQCRNILIYGSCKFQDKGCIYYHPPAQDAPLTQPRADSPAIGTISADAVHAPIFVPKSAAATLVSRATSPPTTPNSNGNHYPNLESDSPRYDSYGYAEDGMQYYDNSQYNGYSQQESDSTPFFTASSSQVFVTEPLNYHLYTEMIPQAFMPWNIDTHFLPSSPEHRQLLHTRSHTIRSLPPPGLNLPEDLQGYHSLVPLEPTNGQERRKMANNWFTSVYRAINSTDGTPYCLRRVENFRLHHHTAFNVIEAWSKIRHPNIVPVREAFTTKAFSDNSLVVVYAYYPGAKTLYDTHIKITPPTFQTSFHGRSQLLTQSQPTPVPERTLWSYLIQIASAIRRAHESAMPVRMIDPTKILVTGKNRIRIGSCGLFDVLTHDIRSDVHLLIQEDINAFGRLMLCLCCASANAASNANYNRSMEMVARLYTPEIKNLVTYLTSKNPMKSIAHVFDLIGGRIALEMEDALSATDRLERELMSELENARLVRLLCKFGFINERPEFARDPRWSDTGDRYIIKLFRDYVFHQVDESGNPITNLSHVLTCLNKLDAGTDEKLMLVARDEQSCLVVSYKEIKGCIDSAMRELGQFRRNY